MIVIPMAGLSRRFTEVGYSIPKYRLPLRGKTVFTHSVASFQAYFEREEFMFVALDDGQVSDFIRSEAAALGIRSLSIVLLSSPTAGQADTVAQGIAAKELTRTNEPITIFNIDTFRPGFTFPSVSWLQNAGGYLEVMPGNDPGFSYVRPDPKYDNQRVGETAEKRVISNLASTGLYRFRSAALFLQAFETERSLPQAAELYIAPLYNTLIKQGEHVHYHSISSDQVLFCGLPAQYEALRQSDNWPE